MHPLHTHKAQVHGTEGEAAPGGSGELERRKQREALLEGCRCAAPRRAASRGPPQGSSSITSRHPT